MGCSSAQVSYHLYELVEAGDLVCASPWPGGLRGYQPAGSWTDEPPLFALAELVADERQWMLDELRRWASLHGGQAPRQKEWSKENDPKRGWPRWDRVAELFEARRSTTASAIGLTRDAPWTARARPVGTTRTARARCSATAASTAEVTARTGTWVTGSARRDGGTRCSSPDSTCGPAADGAPAIRGAAAPYSRLSDSPAKTWFAQCLVPPTDVAQTVGGDFLQNAGGREPRMLKGDGCRCVASCRPARAHSCGSLPACGQPLTRQVAW